MDLIPSSMVGTTDVSAENIRRLSPRFLSFRSRALDSVLLCLPFVLPSASPRKVTDTEPWGFRGAGRRAGGGGGAEPLLCLPCALPLQ